MENLFMFLATSLVLRTNYSRFKRYLIFPGCSTLLNPGAKTLQVRHTKDGDKLYFNEYCNDGVTYGLICVRMCQSTTKENMEKILVHFVNRLRKPWQICVNLGMDFEQSPAHLSMTDYWQDKANIDWKIKAYAKDNIIAFLYVKNITDTSVKCHDAYLNGFKFSAGSRN